MSPNGHQPVLHFTRIDLSAETRAAVIDRLNHTLACTLDLKTQVKQAHWNVKGMDFYQLHELFDEIAEELEAYVDLFAERITALGGVALGTVRMAASQSILPEYPVEILDGRDHVTALADRVAPYAKLLRANIQYTDEQGDADTADLYTEVSRTLDKRLWFLEAHLQADAAPTCNGATPASELTEATSTKATPKSATTKKLKTKAK